MPLPNFLVIGAAKAGTTSLHAYLGQHPGIFMSRVKEPRFLAFAGTKPAFRGPGDEEAINRPTISTLDEYRSLFTAAGSETAIGESSAMYLTFPDRVIPEIERHLGSVRCIAVLRNPIDRAYSNYLQLRRDGDEPLDDFERALDDEPRRAEANWSPMWLYARRGLYAAQIRAYFEAFGRSRVQVYLYEEFSARPHEVLRRIHGFLGVDAGFETDLSQTLHRSGIPKSRTLHRLLAPRSPTVASVAARLPGSVRARARGMRDRNLERPPMPSGARRRLSAYYAADVAALEELLGRRLKGWAGASG